MNIMISDKEIDDYVKESFNEEIIRRYEDQFLLFLKTRMENYPSDKNNEDWLSFTNWVCKRRTYIKNKLNMKYLENLEKQLKE